MPNHTQIKLSVKKKGSGKYANSKKIDVLDAPPAMAGDRMAALLSRFTFEKIVPMPDYHEDYGGRLDVTKPTSARLSDEAPSNDWYSWRLDHWDTKWDAYDVYSGVDSSNEDDTINLYKSGGRFATAWSPPYKVIRKMQELFPNFEISMKYLDEGYMFAGQMFSNGEVVETSDRNSSLFDIIEKAYTLDFISSEERYDMHKENEEVGG